MVVKSEEDGVKSEIVMVWRAEPNRYMFVNFVGKAYENIGRDKKHHNVWHFKEIPEIPPVKHPKRRKSVTVLSVDQLVNAVATAGF